MAKKPETIFKERALSDLVKLQRVSFGRVWFQKIQQVAIHGTPDILACIAGRFVAIELKDEDGELSPSQVYHLGKIRKAGGIAIVATPSTWDDVLNDIVDVVTCSA